MGPASTPTQMKMPCTHFSGKDMRVRGGPEVQVVCWKFLVNILEAVPVLRINIIFSENTLWTIIVVVNTSLIIMIGNCSSGYLVYLKTRDRLQKVQLQNCSYQWGQAAQYFIKNMTEKCKISHRESELKEVVWTQTFYDNIMVGSPVPIIVIPNKIWSVK